MKPTHIDDLWMHGTPDDVVQALYGDFAQQLKRKKNKAFKTNMIPTDLSDADVVEVGQRQYEKTISLLSNKELFLERQHELTEANLELNKHITELNHDHFRVNEDNYKAQIDTLVDKIREINKNGNVKLDLEMKGFKGDNTNAALVLKVASGGQQKEILLPLGMGMVSSRGRDIRLSHRGGAIALDGLEAFPMIKNASHTGLSSLMSFNEIVVANVFKVLDSSEWQLDPGNETVRALKKMMDETLDPITAITGRMDETYRHTGKTQIQTSAEFLHLMNAYLDIPKEDYYGKGGAIKQGIAPDMGKIHALIIAEMSDETSFLHKVTGGFTEGEAEIYGEFLNKKGNIYTLKGRSEITQNRVLAYENYVGQKASQVFGGSVDIRMAEGTTAAAFFGVEQPGKAHTRAAVNAIGRTVPIVTTDALRSSIEEMATPMHKGGAIGLKIRSVATNAVEAQFKGIQGQASGMLMKTFAVAGGYEAAFIQSLGLTGNRFEGSGQELNMKYRDWLIDQGRDGDARDILYKHGMPHAWGGEEGMFHWNKDMKIDRLKRRSVHNIKPELLDTQTFGLVDHLVGGGEVKEGDVIGYILNKATKERVKAVQAQRTGYLSVNVVDNESRIAISHLTSLEDQGSFVLKSIDDPRTLGGKFTGYHTGRTLPVFGQETTDLGEGEFKGKRVAGSYNLSSIKDGMSSKGIDLIQTADGEFIGGQVRTDDFMFREVDNSKARLPKKKAQGSSLKAQLRQSQYVMSKQLAKLGVLEHVPEGLTRELHAFLHSKHTVFDEATATKLGWFDPAKGSGTIEQAVERFIGNRAELGSRHAAERRQYQATKDIKRIKTLMHEVLKKEMIGALTHQNFMISMNDPSSMSNADFWKGKYRPNLRAPARKPGWENAVPFTKDIVEEMGLEVRTTKHAMSSAANQLLHKAKKAGLSNIATAQYVAGRLLKNMGVSAEARAQFIDTYVAKLDNLQSILDEATRISKMQLPHVKTGHVMSNTDMIIDQVLSSAGVSEYDISKFKTGYYQSLAKQADASIGFDLIAEKQRDTLSEFWGSAKTTATVGQILRKEGVKVTPEMALQIGRKFNENFQAGKKGFMYDVVNEVYGHYRGRGYSEEEASKLAVRRIMPEVGVRGRVANSYLEERTTRFLNLQSDYAESVTQKVVPSVSFQSELNNMLHVYPMLGKVLQANKYKPVTAIRSGPRDLFIEATRAVMGGEDGMAMYRNIVTRRMQGSVHSDIYKAQLLMTGNAFGFTQKNLESHLIREGLVSRVGVWDKRRDQGTVVKGLRKLAEVFDPRNIGVYDEVQYNDVFNSSMRYLGVKDADLTSSSFRFFLSGQHKEAMSKLLGAPGIMNTAERTIAENIQKNGIFIPGNAMLGRTVGGDAFTGAMLYERHAIVKSLAELTSALSGTGPDKDQLVQEAYKGFLGTYNKAVVSLGNLFGDVTSRQNLGAYYEPGIYGLATSFTDTQASAIRRLQNGRSKLSDARELATAYISKEKFAELFSGKKEDYYFARLKRDPNLATTTDSVVRVMVDGRLTGNQVAFAGIESVVKKGDHDNDPISLIAMASNNLTKRQWLAHAQHLRKASEYYTDFYSDLMEYKDATRGGGKRTDAKFKKAMERYDQAYSDHRNAVEKGNAKAAAKLKTKLDKSRAYINNMLGFDIEWSRTLEGSMLQGLNTGRITNIVGEMNANLLYHLNKEGVASKVAKKVFFDKYKPLMALGAVLNFAGESQIRSFKESGTRAAAAAMSLMKGLDKMVKFKIGESDVKKTAKDMTDAIVNMFGLRVGEEKATNVSTKNKIAKNFDKLKGKILFAPGDDTSVFSKEFLQFVEKERVAGFAILDEAKLRTAMEEMITMVASLQHDDGAKAEREAYRLFTKGNNFNTINKVLGVIAKSGASGDLLQEGEFFTYAKQLNVAGGIDAIAGTDLDLDYDKIDARKVKGASAGTSTTAGKVGAAMASDIPETIINSKLLATIGNAGSGVLGGILAVTAGAALGGLTGGGAMLEAPLPPQSPDGMNVPPGDILGMSTPAAYLQNESAVQSRMNVRGRGNPQRGVQQIRESGSSGYVSISDRSLSDRGYLSELETRTSGRF